MIVALGGRTGRDGIHGATFSSAELTSHSETLSGGAVQIGNAITEKMLLDVLLVARDRGLYNAVTDCGAGGFSSAVGEMGEKIGAEVWLERVPLKYEGLSYTEIWISEAQERMVLSVSPEKWDELNALCTSEGVEATVIGQFVPNGRLILKYADRQVADMAMAFLHDGRPPVVRDAVYTPPPSCPLSLRERARVRAEQRGTEGVGTREEEQREENIVELRRVTEELDRLGRYIHAMEATKADSAADVLEDTVSPHPNPLPEGEGTEDYTDSLLTILASLNVASKEWVIRQYDHEVQGGSVLKPLVGVTNDGPGDAAVLRPVLDSRRGIVVACGMNPCYGEFDTYWMAASAIDEAVRNCVAVGADPHRIAILDNFCWGTTDRPETLGSLVRAALACHDVAIELGTPFISGKDSLNNEFRPHGAAEPISIPPSLLISALGQIDDVSHCVSMDLKESGNLLYLVGTTKNELGGSHFAMVEGLSGGDVPRVDAKQAKATFLAVHKAIYAGLIRACHDLSEGGLAVAAAEMAFAGGLGATISLDVVPSPFGRGAGGEGNSLPSPSGRGAGGEGPLSPAALLFSESNTRFLCEVRPQNAAAFEAALSAIPHARIGEATDAGTLKILADGATVVSADVSALKEAWQKPLRW
jgi:phosphoribosylformylglycinamidine synthase